MTKDQVGLNRGSSVWDHGSSTAARSLLPHEDDFRHLADHLPTLCWMAEPDGWIFWYNRRWHDYCGTTAEDMAGWGWQSVHHPDVLPSVMTKWNDCIRHGHAFEMVFPIRGADGVYRPFLTKVEPMRDHTGAVTRWFGMNTDISDLQEKERLLLEAHEQLEMALDSGAVRGTWVWDVTSDRVKGDARFARTFSIDPEALRQGVPLSVTTQAIHPDDISSVNEAIRSCIASGSPYSHEYRVRDISGEYRWIEANGRCEHDSQGRPVRFPGVIVDVHRRKLAEEQQKRAAVEAEEASRILHYVINAMPALIFRKDREGRLQLANESVLELLGKSWSDVQGQPDDFYLHPEFAEQIKEHDRQVMATGQALEVEELAGYRNGKPRVWLSRKSPFYNAAGEIDGIIGTSLEITDRKESEDVRRLLIRELNHRIKNLFAMAISLVRVTGRTSTDTRELSEKLVARLHSLATAHNLVLPAVDGPATEVFIDLRSLLETLLAPYEHEHLIALQGPAVPVPGQRVSELALICHELATNAAKYGALSVPNGRLTIAWSLAGEDLNVSWTEADGPALVHNDYKGFGSQLIDSLVRGNLKGDIARTWTETGVSVTLRLNLTV